MSLPFYLFTLQIGRFKVELSPGLFVCIPGIGAAHYCREFGLTCDPWFGPNGLAAVRSAGR